jgi:hypothetical protein
MLKSKRTLILSLILALVFVLAISGVVYAADSLDELEEWDLVYITDSSGMGVADKFADNIERDTGKTVRISGYGYTVGDSSAIRVLQALQSDPESLSDIKFKPLQADIAEAEVIVLFVTPRGDPSKGGVHDEGMEKCIGCDGHPSEDCTLQLYEPYIENLKAIYEEILALRNGKPTIIRAVDFYNPLISEHRKLNMEIECTQCWEIFNTAVRQAADAFNIPFVSVYDVFNGLNHDEDPREKGYIRNDGRHTSKQGQQVIADLLSEAGYEPVEP